MCPNPCFVIYLSDAIIDSFVYNGRRSVRGGFGRIDDGGRGTWYILLQGEIAPLTKSLIKSYYLEREIGTMTNWIGGRTYFDGYIFIYKSIHFGVIIFYVV